MPVRSYSQVLSVVQLHLSSCVHLQFLLLKPRSANQYVLLGWKLRFVE